MTADVKYEEMARKADVNLAMTGGRESVYGRDSFVTVRSKANGERMFTPSKRIEEDWRRNEN